MVLFAKIKKAHQKEYISFAALVVQEFKVVAVGFNTLCYDAERRGIKPSARIKMVLFE